MVLPQNQKRSFFVRWFIIVSMINSHCIRWCCAFSSLSRIHHHSISTHRTSFRMQSIPLSSLFGRCTISTASSGTSNRITPSSSFFSSSSSSSSSSLTVLQMAVGPRQTRGLEVYREGATPLPGGMELYLKAASDSVSVGDCPFAHYVRLVLEEKQLEYLVKPCVQSTKPTWLIDYYDGKMPALRHRKECYVESDVIVSYLEFFFPNPTLSCNDPNMNEKAETAIDGIFPLIAKYIRYVKDDDETDSELLQNLHHGLNRLEEHFRDNIVPTITTDTNGEYYLTGPTITTLDCSLIPKLYHMEIACKEFKTTSNGSSKLTIPQHVQKYMNTMYQRESFQKTMYPPEVIIWGWSNARK